MKEATGARESRQGASEQRQRGGGGGTMVAPMKRVDWGRMKLSSPNCISRPPVAGISGQTITQSECGKLGATVDQSSGSGETNI